LRSATELAHEGIDVEVLDMRTLSPWDRTAVLESVSRTRRLLVVDPAWRSFSASAEIIASVAETLGNGLASPPARLCLPDSHTPMSSALEKLYYPAEDEVKASVRQLLA
jgi:pyruvate dehydrogenase E1 component beta subunit